MFVLTSVVQLQMSVTASRQGISNWSLYCRSIHSSFRITVSVCY